jgi:hypothetical protein
MEGDDNNQERAGRSRPSAMSENKGEGVAVTSCPDIPTKFTAILFFGEKSDLGGAGEYGCS